MHDTKEEVSTRGLIRRTVLLPLFAIAGVGLIVSACGSQPTIAAFNSQANGICRTYIPRLKDVEATIALPNNGNEHQLEGALSSALPQAEQGSARLEALARPSGEGPGLTKAFNSASAQIQELKGLAAALKSGNQNKIETSETAIEQSEAPLNQQFDTLGLTDCG
jgi:hypothetical protein